MKIATIIGARPQFIKAAVVSEKIKNTNAFSEIIVHTGQHFGKKMSKIFFEEMRIPEPNYNLNINQVEYGKMIEKMTKKITPILIKEKVHGILVYGDTNSTLAGCISAKQLNLPIFHVEAGLRSYNRLMYEENNRLLTDHFSSLLFCPSKNAVKNLHKENVNEGIVFTGDVMYDAYLKFSSLKNVNKKDLTKSKFILATIHRRENLNSYQRLSTIFKNLDEISDMHKIIMPTHPHTKTKIIDYKIKSDVTFIEPQGYLSMLELLNACDLVITDSGGLQKESFFAKKKCITVRDQTEWTELINQGVNTLCHPKDLNTAYVKTLKKKCEFSNNLYGDGNASNLIIESIDNFFQNK